MFVLPDVKPWSQILTDEPKQFENVSRKYYFSVMVNLPQSFFRLVHYFFPLLEVFAVVCYDDNHKLESLKNILKTLVAEQTIIVLRQLFFSHLFFLLNLFFENLQSGED